MLRNVVPGDGLQLRVDLAPPKNGRASDATVTIPASTYRLQLHRDFDFRAATGVVDYLASLGASDCYVSPYFKAVPGSTHGYDICDHGVLNPELGTDDDYAAFTQALERGGMGQVLDFVPNHMAVAAADNPWWRDVLENGPASLYARFFDIDWAPVKPELRDKVLLPILEDHYGRELERGRFQLAWADGSFSLNYGEHRLPLNPRTVPRLLESNLDRLRAEIGEEHADTLELMSIATALRNLPSENDVDAPRRQERHREKEVARSRLQRVTEQSAAVRAHVQRLVEQFNRGGGEAIELMHALLEEQRYRLAYWRTAADEINYRRFFDINHLAGLRMNDESVFAYAHALLLRLIAGGAVTGLRLDHVDGLFDPADYLERLQRAAAAALGVAMAKPAIYCVVEKILSRDESLPPAWPVAGTTGYEFLNQLNGVFIDRLNHRKMLAVYRRFTGQRRSFRDVAYESKRDIIDGAMSSELNMLAHALNRLSEADRRTRDFTLNSLRRALREVIAAFPIYRIYIGADGPTEHERAVVESAVRDARRRNRSLEPSVFDFVRDALLGVNPATHNGVSEQWRELAKRLQQYTGPVHAKGIEDTALYRYVPLVSANEVGGDPDRLGVPAAEFHRANEYRRAHWPHALLASTTHDTKRSEDVRARINVLSELPEVWGRHVNVWSRINGAHRAVIDGARVPERNEEYLFYQTLVGAWPLGRAQPDAEFITRMRDYMLKAAREAKIHTSWLYPDSAYEAGLMRFVEHTLSGPTADRFLASFLPFQRRIARWGMLNGLSQLVLKIASPGACDFYQGTELWTFSLVDPDNRRPVDFALRRELLAALDHVHELTGAARLAALAGLLNEWEDGRIKLFLTSVGLRCRRRRPGLFLDGSYTGLEASGPRQDHVVALARRWGEHTVIAVVPRLVARLSQFGDAWPVADTWAQTSLCLPPLPAHTARFYDLLTGRSIEVDRLGAEPVLPLSDVLQHWPVALLSSSNG